MTNHKHDWYKEGKQAASRNLAKNPKPEAYAGAAILLHQILRREEMVEAEIKQAKAEYLRGWNDGTISKTS